jgi:hypothetical protein
MTRMLEVRARISLMHDEVDKWNSYMSLTFNPEIIGDNRDAVEFNLDRYYSNFISQTEDISKMIENLHL